MSSYASGIGNRFGSLAVNIHDPTETPKVKAPRPKRDGDHSKIKRPQAEAASGKKFSTVKTAQDSNKKATKENRTQVSSKDLQETANLESKSEQIIEEDKIKEPKSSGRYGTRNRGRGRTVPDSESQATRRDESSVGVNRGGSPRRPPRSQGRRDFNHGAPRFPQEGYSSRPDLDEEVPPPARFERRGDRFNREAHHNRADATFGRRNRVFDRHSGTVTGSTAYNKREFRGPDSALLKETSFNSNDNDQHGSIEKQDSSFANEVDESAVTSSGALKTMTLDEYRKMEEKQKVVADQFDKEGDEPKDTSAPQSQVPADASVGPRGRYRRGYGGGRRRGPNERSRLENQYRLRTPASPSSSPKERVERAEIKIDLEKDFPALSI